MTNELVEGNELVNKPKLKFATPSWALKIFKIVSLCCVFSWTRFNTRLKIALTM